MTGESPARVARTELITGHLKWVELATILLVVVAIALHFRAPGAAAVAIAAVAVAYLSADRLVLQLGKLMGIAVPAEVQPVLVVLVFGVVTDYSVFFLSRFRALLASGPRFAGRRRSKRRARSPRSSPSRVPRWRPGQRACSRPASTSSEPLGRGWPSRW